MSKILLSIKPKYVNEILEGHKKYEFRRKIPRQNIDRIIIYASTPVKKVVGEVEVLKTITMDKEKLWKTTFNEAGIDEDEFFYYFTDCEKANAFVLGRVVIYSALRSLEDYGCSHAPQSFIYLE